MRKSSRAKHTCAEIPLCEGSPCERFSYCIKGNIYLTRAPVKVSRVQLSCAKVSRAVIYTCGDLSCGNQYVQGIGPYDHHIYVMSPTLNLTLTPRPYSHPSKECIDHEWQDRLGRENPPPHSMNWNATWIRMRWESGAVCRKGSQRCFRHGLLHLN